MAATPMRSDRPKGLPDLVPGNIAELLQRFMLDKRTGNVVLNIREGEILKAVIEDHVRAS